MAVTRSMAKRGGSSRSPQSSKPTPLTRSMSRRHSSPLPWTAIKPSRTFQAKNAARKARKVFPATCSPSSRKTSGIYPHSSGLSRSRLSAIACPFSPEPSSWASSSESQDMEVDSDEYGGFPMDIDEEYEVDALLDDDDDYDPYSLEAARRSISTFHYNLSRTFDDDYLNEEILKPLHGSIIASKPREAVDDDGYSADVEDAVKYNRPRSSSRLPPVRDLGDEEKPVVEGSDTLRSSGQSATNSTSTTEVSAPSMSSGPLASIRPIPAVSGMKEEPTSSPKIPPANDIGQSSSSLDIFAPAPSVATSRPLPSSSHCKRETVTPCPPDALEVDPFQLKSEPQPSLLHDERKASSPSLPDSQDEDPDEYTVEQILLGGILESPEISSGCLPNVSATAPLPAPSTVSETLSQALVHNERKKRKHCTLRRKIEGRPLSRVSKRCTVSRLAHKIAHLALLPMSGAVAASSEDLPGRAASLSLATGITRSLRRRLTHIQSHSGSVSEGGRRRSARLSLSKEWPK